MPDSYAHNRSGGVPLPLWPPCILPAFAAAGRKSSDNPLTAGSARQASASFLRFAPLPSSADADALLHPQETPARPVAVSASSAHSARQLLSPPRLSAASPARQDAPAKQSAGRSGAVAVLPDVWSPQGLQRRRRVSSALPPVHGSARPVA